MLKIKDFVDLKELDDISLEDFVNYVKKIRNDDITFVAPLGFSGNTFIIFENKNKPLRKEKYTDDELLKFNDEEYYNKPVWRSCQVSMRKYGSECELLITDYYGEFLTYSKLNFCFSDEFIATNFYNIFLQLKPYINKSVDNQDIKIDFNEVEFSKGFEMINAYMNKSKDGIVEKVEE